MGQTIQWQPSEKTQTWWTGGDRNLYTRVGVRRPLLFLTVLHTSWGHHGPSMVHCCFESIGSRSWQLADSRTVWGSNRRYVRSQCSQIKTYLRRLWSTVDVSARLSLIRTYQNRRFSGGREERKRLNPLLGKKSGWNEDVPEEKRGNSLTPWEEIIPAQTQEHAYQEA